LKIHVFNLPSEVRDRLSGWFTHLDTDGEPLLIGGVAREALKVVLLGEEFAWNAINDRDFTVIGGSSYQRDLSPHGRRRIEVEYGAHHKTIRSYMATRDLSINQIAVDRHGRVFASGGAVKAYRAKTIEAIESPTSRMLVRALRFRKELGFRLSKPLWKSVIAAGETLRWEPVADRYISEGLLSMEDFQ
jgi:hypothetical protein